MVCCRYVGQKIMYMLMEHPEFDRMVRRSVSSMTLSNIQPKLDALRLKVPQSSHLYGYIMLSYC